MGLSKKRSLAIQESIWKDIEEEGFISLEELDPLEFEPVAQGKIEKVDRGKKSKKIKATEFKECQVKAKEFKEKLTKVKDPKETQAKVKEFKDPKENSTKKIKKPTAPKSFRIPFALPQTDLQQPEPSTEGMDDWNAYLLNEKILAALNLLNFKSPTPIQEAVLTQAIGNHRDILGTAKTGSGKTLAYGLPILNSLATNPPCPSQLTGLILVPTRELGMQVARHLKQAAHFLEKAKIVSIIGGMSMEKQSRQLFQSPDIVIATPGRLWELMNSSQVPTFMESLKKLKFFVIDEADRMIEAGHFRELESILAALYYNFSQAQEDGAMVKRHISFQTFVFSATLSLCRKSKRGDIENPIDSLLEKISFRGDAKPFAVDLTEDSKQLTPESLSEYKIALPKDQKDLFLYYALSFWHSSGKSKGKCIVFLNSIDGIRRMMPLLANLQVKAYALHSQLQQKQRIKNIERFTEDPNGVLICSDVAARGLDIPAVQLVIHFQLPKSPALYVHRSGRTARGQNAGTSIAFVDEEDFSEMQKILKHLKKQDLPKAHVDMNIITRLRPIVTIARQIDEVEHVLNKAKFDNSWLQETAEAMEVEVDEKMLKDTAQEKQIRAQAKQMRDNLAKQMEKFTQWMSNVKVPSINNS